MHLVIFVVIPAILFYLIGIPSFLFWKLRKNSENILMLDQREDLPRGEKHVIETFYKRYGFFI